jgi:hypothetical protein
MGDAAAHLQEAVTRWQNSVNYMQQHMGTANAFVEANPQFAQTPLNYGSAVNNAQQWLDSARQALATQDQGVIRAALETSRNAWRGGVDPNAIAASRQAVTRIVPQVAQQAVPIGRMLTSQVPAIQQAAVPIMEVLAAEAPVIAAQVEQNAPQIVTVGTGAGGAAAAAGWSWTAILAGGAVVVLVLAGGYVLYRQATSSSSSAPSVQAAPQGQDVGALPDPGLTGDAPPPVQTPLPTPVPTDDPQTPDAQTPEPETPDSGTPVPPPVAQPEPVTTQGQSPPEQQTAPTPNPTPTPTPCALPNSIGVTGGDHSSLGPSGGSFTVTSTPVVLSADAPDCGDPYKLSFGASRPSGGTVSGSSCHPHGDISYNISSGPNPVQVGDSVTVNLEAPPNSC